MSKKHTLPPNNDNKASLTPELTVTGTFHFTDAGIASWYDFAVSIQEEALAAGLLSKTISIHPVPASQYPTPAKRPLCCILDKQKMWQAAGINPVHWRIQLRTMLQELTN